MIVICLMSLFAVANNCGQCTCSDDLSWMACNGETVILFPELTPSDKTLVTAIEIENSYIFTLPFMTQQDYPSLIIVKIINNINLDCDYARQWYEALKGQGTVITDCLLSPEPEQTTAAQCTEAEWDTSTQQWSEQSTEYSSTQYRSRTTVLIVLIALSCTVLTAIVALLIHCRVKKRPVRSPLTHHTETNSIYRMTTLDELESSA